MNEAKEKKPRSLIHLALLITLPLLAVALVIFVIADGFSKIASAITPKFERNVASAISHSIADIRATKGDILILAEMESLQTIREDDTRLVKVPYADFNISMGTTMSEVRVPAHFRFFVRLSEPFEVKITEHGDLRRCVVTAPPLEAQTPVTFDSNRMEIRVDAGWLRFNKDEAKEKVIKSITPVLDARAPENARLARDKARTAFAAFVRSWLLRDKLLGAGAVEDVIVLFPGEEGAAVQPSTTFTEDR